MSPDAPFLFTPPARADEDWFSLGSIKPKLLVQVAAAQKQKTNHTAGCSTKFMKETHAPSIA